MRKGNGPNEGLRILAELVAFVQQLVSGSLVQPVPERLCPSHEALAWAGMESSQDIPNFLWESLHFTGVGLCT